MTVAKEDERGSLKVRAISKRYGSRLVVNQVDLTILAGEVVGLLGPNGAGKTTTFSMVSGFTTPSEGENRFKWKRYYRISSVPQSQKGSCISTAGVIRLFESYRLQIMSGQ